MKKHRARRSGFVLVIIIVALTVISMYMYALAGTSRVIILETNHAYVKACEENLTASGLAWARHNTRGEPASTFTEPVKLSVDEMYMGPAQLTVTINGQNIDVRTSCTHRRETLSNTKKFNLAGTERIGRQRSSSH